MISLRAFTYTLHTETPFAFISFLNIVLFRHCYVLVCVYTHGMSIIEQLYVILFFFNTMRIAFRKFHKLFNRFISISTLHIAIITPIKSFNHFPSFLILKSCIMDLPAINTWSRILTHIFVTFNVSLWLPQTGGSNLLTEKVKKIVQSYNAKSPQIGHLRMPVLFCSGLHLRW
jgi:hypothetical protein